jgi:hypothetical protein
MWMSTTSTKERLPAIRGTAHGPHTDLGCALSMGTRPRDLCLKGRTMKSLSLPILALVESFPGAMSPLRSKDLYETTYCQTLHPSYKSHDERWMS